MGVAGSGKSTVGRMVADACGWTYFEADDFHSPQNKSKMRQGTPLNDDDREPWLASIRSKMEECRAAGQSAVFTCSALKERYRVQLGLGGDQREGLLVYLAADQATVMARVSQRQDHYLKAGLVRSQFESLEPPGNAFTIDATLPPDRIVRLIVGRLEQSG